MLQDLRYALRLMAKAPGFSLLIVFALALGLGANTAIFTAAHDFLFRPLPFRDPGRLVAITEIGMTKELLGWTSPRDYLDWKAQNRVFDEMAAWSSVGVNLTGGSEPERVPGIRVTASFFALMGVQPLVGRGFLPQEDVPRGNPVVVLSYSLWQRRFSGRRDILGQTVTANGTVVTVVGVMPPGFWFSNAHEEFYMPLGLNPAETYRGGKYLKVIARLKGSVSPAQAQVDMKGLLATIRRIDPTATQSVAIEGLRDHMARDVKPALLALLGAVGLVLLIACANVANMLLARTVTREKEIAVRRAVGAQPGRILRQMLIESLLLAAAGAMLGLLVALWGVNVIYRAIPEGIRPLRLGGVDWTILGFTFLLTLLTTLLFGLAPAWTALGADLVQPLKEGAGRQSGARGGGLRRWLLIFEVALSVVLLSGAGTLLKSFVRLAAVDPGFRPEGVLAVRIQGQQHLKEFCSAVLERAAALPGVVATGAVSNLPMTGQDWGQNLTVEGRPFRGDQDYIWATHRVASLEYFHTMGMRLLKGRSFGAADTRDTPRVAVVNETFARKAWPGEDPIGRRFRIGDFPKYAGAPINVIGVVADAKYMGLADEAWPEMFFSMNQDGAPNGMTFVFRAAQDHNVLLGSVRGLVRSIDHNQPIAKVTTMEALVAESAAPQRLTTILGALFGVLALVLAGTGLYGVVSYSVSQRTHEIGIRMAMGAHPRSVVRLVVVHALKLTVVGLALGLLAAIAFGRLLSGLLFQVSPHDPFILTGVSVVFTAVALMASYLPARRAADIDPLSALRCN